jgi:hypothetical protein
MQERRLKETWPRVYEYFGLRLPRGHNQVSCRASCPLDSGYCRDIRSTWTSTSIWVDNSGQLNRLGPSGLNGLGWIILSLILGPGRVDLMGLTTEKAGIFPNKKQYAWCIYYHMMKSNVEDINHMQ